MANLAISIINYKTKELTEKCLEALLDKRWQNKVEIWLVDNGSGDGSVEYLKKRFNSVNFIESKTNLGFAGGHNLALKKVKSDYVLILNSDTEVLDSSLDQLVNFMEKNEYGIASCTLLNSDGSFQPNGGDLPNLISIFVWLSGMDDFMPNKEGLPSLHRKFKSYYEGEKKIGWVGGAAMIISQMALNKIGPLDDKIFMYAEDIEYCLRAKKMGIKVGFTDKAQIKHLGGGSLDDPQLRQWLGEFKGLRYIYKKHFNVFDSLLLNFMIYFFVILRIIVFAVLGRFNISKTYAAVFKSL